MGNDHSQTKTNEKRKIEKPYDTHQQSVKAMVYVIPKKCHWMIPKSFFQPLHPQTKRIKKMEQTKPNDKTK